MRLIDADKLIQAVGKLMPKKMPYDYDENDNDLGAILCDVREIIDEQPTVNEWTPCENLPEYTAVDELRRINEVNKQYENKQEFIKCFAHFMTESDLNSAFDTHFKELGNMNCKEIERWLKDILGDKGENK